ncbi:MAG: thiamine pyrophosphate-dependent enzyme [Pseudomonadota bacterium]|nr:thiamine pyrophosphate-dependent enzyme [Pseudomonadota bacterium]
MESLAAPSPAFDPLADALAGALLAVRAYCAADPAVVSGRGLEALIAGVALGAPRKAWLLPGRRERACALVRGCGADRLDQARPFRVVPPGDSPAARALYGVGLALAGDPAVVFCGTGTVGYGAFHEALQLAAVHRAPVTFVVAWYANVGPFAPPLAVSPAVLARALGLAATVVDGTDAAAVRDAVAAADGPTLIEARLTGRS